MADSERSWDAVVETLAYLGLLSAGAYAGVKHFPSITLRRAASSLSSKLLPTKGRAQGLLGHFHKIFGSTPGPPAPGWKATRPQDLTLIHEMETAISVFKADSRITGASVDDVARSFLSRHAADVPQAVGSATPLTVRDFMARNMGMSNLVASIGGDNVNRLRDSIRELVRLPGFRQSLARQGMTVEQFMGRVPVGGFMMNTPEGVMSARGGIRALLEDVSNIRFPFTQNFKPFSLLIPDLSPKPGMTMLGPAASKAMFGAEDALFVQGQIYPISSEAGSKLLGRPTAGYRLASTRQVGAARAAAARMGLLRPAKPTIAGRQDKSRARRIAELQMRRLQRQTGVGPGWSGRRSRVENILGRAWAVAEGAKPKFLPQTGTPAAGLTPEGALLRRVLGRPTGAVRGPGDLTMTERARLWLGGTVRRPFFEEGKFVAKPVAHVPAVPSIDRIMPKPFGRAEYYAIRGGQGASDWLNYQVTRPLWLLSEMTGLGMKPGRSPLESIGQIGLKMALPAYVGYQALEYAEYKSNRWLGFGPITGPAWAYTQARVGAQSVLDSIGVTDVLRETEEKYPGSIESPASRGIRAGAAVLGGLLGARRLPGQYAKYAAMAGGAALGYLQLAGINKPADELTQIYSGEKDVPVRAGRWWVLGRQPWSGGKIKFWQPSWYHRLQTRPGEVGLYGSRQEARRASWLPTPENWFLLKNLYDPYYLEREHYQDRPYPATSGLFGELPLVGPLAERTVGRILKPVRRREVPVSAGSAGVGDADYRQALAHGYGPRPERSPTPQTDRLEIMTGETIYRLFDWTGLPGFMVGALREQLTGKTGWYLDRRAEATSGAMASPQRDYYDRNLGGLLGATEFFRRFVPNDQGYRKINPLENRMPDWLPGRRSVFRGDRESFIDFHTGDAFTKIEKGEMRLPGAGWEAARRGVDDVTPGMYSALDRFQILADVAPGSQALKHYRKMVEGMAHTGQLSRQDLKRFTQTQNQMAESLKSRVGAAGYRYGADEFADKEVTIASTGLTTFTTHEHPGMRFHLAGVEGRTYALEGSSDEYGKLRRRLAELRGKTVSMTYGGFGRTTPAILGDVNRRAIDAGLGKYKPVDDLDFRAKHGTNIFRQGYEWAIHSTLPGPLGYPRTKFVGQMAPIEEYESFVRMGTWDTGWESPVENYIVPWSNQLVGATSGAQLKTRRINEYMDRFKFAKYSALSERAGAMGDAYAAGRFADTASETLVAANPYAPDFYSDVFGALPSTERPYFAAFAGVTSEKRQEQILNSVPEDLAPIYMGVWDRAAGQDGFHSPVLRRYAEQARAVTAEMPEARVADYFAHQPLPDPTYAGWHPAVDEDTIKVKLAHQEGLDVHQLGMWAPQEIEAEEVRMPAPTEAAEMDRELLYEILRRRGYTRAMITAGYAGDSSVFKFGKPRSRRWQEAHRNLSLQGAV
jgi:hypothetical protein